MPEPNRHTGCATLRALQDRDLLQFGGWDANWPAASAALADALCCPVPERVNHGCESAGLRVLRIAPRRIRVCAAWGDARLAALRSLDGSAFGVCTELGHGRRLLRLHGAGARALLARLMPIDFSPQAFALQAIAQSHIHHVPVLAQLVHEEEDGAAQTFDLHVPRSFGQSIADWVLAHGARWSDAVKTAHIK